MKDEEFKEAEERFKNALLGNFLEGNLFADTEKYIQHFDPSV